MRKLIGLACAVLAVLALLQLVTPQQKRGPLILAASSMKEALDAASLEWTKQGHAAPVISTAGTPALAQQVIAGAKADLFISADDGWMEQLNEKKLLAPASRHLLATNQLVIIAPRSDAIVLTPSPGFPLAAALGKGRLAMADPQSVPAGRYAKASLTTLGVWAQIEDKIAATENVRAALALVERGAAPLGLVYLTDARASKAVRIVAVLPAQTHPQIRYILARLAASSHPDAENLHAFLKSPATLAVLTKYGFVRP